jgi:hypothetical protein
MNKYLQWTNKYKVGEKNEKDMYHMGKSEWKETEKKVRWLKNKKISRIENQKK